MKKYLLSFALVLSLSSFFALPASAANDNNTTNYQMKPADEQKKIADIFKIIMVIDDNERDAAAVALNKTTDSNVKQFAQMMNTDHTKNVEETKKLSEALKINPLTSNKSIALEMAGKKDLDKLNTLQGKAFDTAYIEAMVNGHQAVLQLIDTDLMPNTSNPQVLKLLKTTRAMVAHHLDMARKTQKTLS